MSLYGGVELVGRPDLENIGKLDLLPIPQISGMDRVGFAIDLPALASTGSQLAAEMTDLQRDISSYIPPEDLERFVSASTGLDEEGEEIPLELNANSAPQIRSLLFDSLGVGRGRQLKQTAQGLVSTGKKTLELCREDHPVVSLVLAYRERSKLKSAFCDSLPKFARFHPRGACCPVCELAHDTGQHRVHGQIMTTRAETGRLSMKKPNLMQIPSRSELGGRIRACFVAPPGRRLVSVDFSQMELRDLAHMANARSMIEVYHQDRDIHTYTAMRVFGIDDESKVDKLTQRLPCKNINFMIVYGASWMGLQAQLALSGLFWDEQECKDFIGRWFSLYPEVEDYLHLQEYRARRYGFVWTPCGRVRLVPEVRSCHSYIRSQGIRQAGNMPIQGANAEQTKLVMGELEDEFVRLRAGGVDVEDLVPIHDQVIAEADEETAEMIGSIMSDVFSNVMVDKQSGENLWRVPIKADYEIMEKWVKS